MTAATFRVDFRHDEIFQFRFDINLNPLSYSLSTINLHICTKAAPTAAPDMKVFSILGKNLKANTAAEVEPYLTQLKELDGVEEVHLGGNSLGVEACQAIADVLKTKTTLKVGLSQCVEYGICGLWAYGIGR